MRALTTRCADHDQSPAPKSWGQIAEDAAVAVLTGLVLLVYRRPGAERVDGVTATDWRTGCFTRHRTDLPYPGPTARWLAESGIRWP